MDLTYKNVHWGSSSSHARRSASKVNPPDSPRFGYGYDHAEMGRDNGKRISHLRNERDYPSPVFSRPFLCFLAYPGYSTCLFARCSYHVQAQECMFLLAIRYRVFL